MMASSHDAVMVVEALNSRERVLAGRGTSDPVPPRRDMSIPQSCQDSNGEACQPGDCVLNGPHYATQGGGEHK